MGRFLFSFALLICLSHLAAGQTDLLSNLRKTDMSYSGDTLRIDSLSIVPSSEIIRSGGRILKQDEYWLNYATSELVLFSKSQQNLEIVWRTIGTDLSKPRFNKDPKIIEPDYRAMLNPYEYEVIPDKDPLLDLSDLAKSGSISRGVTFGNNQNLSVNSNLNLEIAGKLNERFNVVASISDENIPIQPEGNTQQLQDFDQVFIKVFDDQNELIAGDFQLERPEGYFMQYFKRSQGATFKNTSPLIIRDSIEATNEFQVSAAVSRGKFARNVIQGVEGNQGPYRLRGEDGETFIVILSGTERIYIDGRLLERGQEFDYVINYNTAEVIFTANQLITKDKRISIEFQYSDRNYARSVLQASDYFKTDRMQLRFDIYSEQDARNQPLQQDLSDAQINVLQNVGDSIDQALASGAIAVGFNDNEVLYALDSITPAGDSIFRFSTDQDSAIYRVRFSDVGQGNGNYQQATAIAIGRVFEFVPPVGGLPQGRYEPIVLLITPKQRQMATIGGDFLISEQTSLSFEGAISRQDINTFSDKNQSDNLGGAGKLVLEHTFNLQNDSARGWQLQAAGDVEWLHKDFNPIERFRQVEFFRNWNLRGVELDGNQTIAGGKLALILPQTVNLNYALKSYDAGSQYRGLRNLYGLDYNQNKTSVLFNGSYTSADFQDVNSDFLRHKTLATQGLGLLTFGYRDDYERNIFRDNLTDTLAPNSYQFWEWEGFVQNADTGKFFAKASYTQRYDEAAIRDRTALATFGQSTGLELQWTGKKGNRFYNKVAYRQLEIAATELTTDQPENTLVNRTEYRLKLWKGAVISNSFYEVNSGLEAKREFTFLPVPVGQGLYVWNDYNGDGLQQLDEFEVAVYTYEADYIKVFVPTNEYQQTFGNQFSQNIQLNPARALKKDAFWKKAIAKFSNQSVFRIDRKTIRDDLEERLNPFANVGDSSLLSTNTSFRNTLYFQRTNPIYGVDFNFQQLENKSLLVNGFETRKQFFRELRFRWNLTQEYGFKVTAKEGNKGNISDLFQNRNFDIRFQSITPELSYQPGTRFRITGKYAYEDKRNIYVYELSENPLELGNERAFIHDFGINLQLNGKKNGNFLVDINYVEIVYQGSTNNALAFEMLESLQPGRNGTWSVTWQKNISGNIQVSLNYNGRTSESAPTIHTGGAQVRAFF